MLGGEIPLRILGIDPGLATTGYAIIDSDRTKNRALAYGCIKTAASKEMTLRFAKIYGKLTEIIKREKPEVMAIEKLFFFKNAISAMQVGEARGISILAACHNNLEVFEYTPLQVKQAVVGYGRAEKVQVQKMVQILLGLKEIPRPDDAADALAVAICHAQTSSSPAAVRGIYV
jgi:crossover junction endodeoxyribonuclease RuvC